MSSPKMTRSGRVHGVLPPTTAESSNVGITPRNVEVAGGLVMRRFESPLVIGGAINTVREEDEYSNARSHSSRMSTASSLLRRRLKAEMDAKAKLLEIQKRKDQIDMQRLESMKNTLQMEEDLTRTELQYHQAEIDEEEMSDTGSQLLSDDDEEKKSPVQNVDSKQPQQKVKHFTAAPLVPIESSAQSVEVIKEITPPVTELSRYMARQAIGRDLPNFDGDPSEWPNFISMYENTTAAGGYSAVENMARLSKCLKGVARDAVVCMLMIPENIEEVITTLRERFGRPAYIVQFLINKAKNTPTPREDALGSIIVFADAVRNLVATMVHLNYTGHMSNPQLLTELVSKLPNNLRISWATRATMNEDETSVKEFSTWLTKMARNINAVLPPDVAFKGKKEEDKRKDRYQAKDKNQTRPMRVFAVSESKSEESRFKTGGRGCHFCSGPNHAIQDCRKFQKENVNSRWKIVKEKDLCFACLKTSHRSIDCTKAQQCGIDDCPKSHHQLLHTAYSKPEVNQETKPEITAHTHTQVESQILLCVLPVTLWGPNGSYKTFAMCDNASTCTLIDSDVARKIGIRGQDEPLNMRWTTEITLQDSRSQRVSFGISGSCKEKYKLENVRTLRKMNLPTQSVDMERIKKQWEHMKDVDIPSLKDAKPTVLIGLDNWQLITPRQTIEAKVKNAPGATLTKLGWVVLGVDHQRKNSEFTFHCWNTNLDSLSQLVKSSYTTEDFGVKPTPQLKSKETERAEEILNSTTKRSGNRWETGLLWKSEEVFLPESKHNALQRLYTLERKMDRDKLYGKQYCDKIEDYVKKGYARILTKEEADITTNRSWYLPHFGVVNPNKPEKLRLVFDAAAQTKGKSLNSELLKGPDLLKPLQSVLFSFRRNRIGFGGDVKEMFHQVNIRKEDLQSQRFLFRGNRRSGEPDIYEMKAMIFGAACSPCCAQEVKNKNAREFEKEYPAAAQAIIDNFYVDDYYDSVNTVDEAVKMITDVIEINRKGGMEVCNWICSSPEVLKKIPPEMRASSSKMVNTGENPTERILGIRWNAEEDIFTYDVNFNKVDKRIVKGERIPTKREVLGLIASVFDPLGFLACFTINGKILMQKIWRCGVTWDEEIPSRLEPKWFDWLEELQSINTFKLPRAYSLRSGEKRNTQLHIFCDGSEDAFCAVAYFRFDYADNVEVSLVMARTRVSPLKPLSVPRLELQGAVMATRLGETIRKLHSFKIDETIYWTDSDTVLCWINSDARNYKQFVSHRIGEILESTDVSKWRYICTKDNVADEGTRDGKADFSPGSRWINGPAFLREPDNWSKEMESPHPRSSTASTPHVDLRGAVGMEWVEEKVKGFREQDLELKTKFVAVCTEQSNLCLPNISRFSSWLRLIRATAWCIKYVRKCFSKIKLRQATVSEPRIQIPNYLILDEINQAELLWLRQVQLESFQPEIMNLKSGKSVAKTSRLVQLSPFVDADGLVKMKGRLSVAAEIADSKKYPVFLEPKHPYTVLLIHREHVKNNHQGMETIANNLRQKYWILDLRAAVRREWRNCQYCKLTRAKPCIPEMGPLPRCRLNSRVRPFTITGLDYWGPMEVTVGRSHQKRYGALFKCMSTGAIHTEIASSLTTDSAIMAIRRFVSRRGYPKEIHSDNGTNFRGADEELKKALAEFNQETLNNEMTIRGIKWMFNPPSAPHMGGSWERMIRSVKTSLKVVLKERAPKEEILATFLTEVENLVNSRPLTYVSSDPNDEDALTPNHFLIGTANENLPPGVFDDGDFCARKQWRMSQRLTEHFWNKWLREYLPTLSKRTKWHGRVEPLKAGDVVLVEESNLARGIWPKGKIVATFPGKDGQTRVADVLLRGKILRRPVHKLWVLDVLEKDPSDKDPLGGRYVGGADKLPPMTEQKKEAEEKSKNVERGAEASSSSATVEADRRTASVV